MDIKSYLSGSGGFGSAVVASLCCVTPLVVAVADKAEAGSVQLPLTRPHARPSLVRT